MNTIAMTSAAPTERVALGHRSGRRLADSADGALERSAPDGDASRSLLGGGPVGTVCSITLPRSGP